MSPNRLTCLFLFALCVQPLLASTSPRPHALPNKATVTAKITATRHDAPSGDSLYKSWYLTPTGVFGRLPLDRPKNHHYIHLSHPSASEAVVQNINPAGIVTTTTHFYFKSGLITLSTSTNRWGDTYDSTWFKPDGHDKFLVRERIHGVNPYLPCKYEQYTFTNNLLTDIVCYLDSIRAGADQNGVAHYVFERYDDPQRRGLIRNETFFTEIDFPTISRTADCHKIRNDYDAKGNLISRSVYDQDDKPMLDRYGVFQTKYKYDDDDNMTEKAFFDIKGAPTIGSRKFAIEYLEYKHGFLTEESYHLSDLSPSVSTALGRTVSVVDYRRDQEGNETSSTFFDAQQRPTSNSRGYHEVDNVYSPSGLLIEQKAFPPGRDNTAQSRIYFMLNVTWDDKGRIVAEQTQTNNGFIIGSLQNDSYLTKFSYDAWGRVKTTSYWTNDSTAMESRLGYHEMINTYNDDGQIVQIDYRDMNGDPAMGGLGYSKMRIGYNGAGLLAERSLFDVDKPVLLEDEGASITHFHRIAYNYDLLNRLRSITFFDPGGDPVVATLRPDRDRTFTAREVDLDWSGDKLEIQTFKGGDDSLSTHQIKCDSGRCIPESMLISPASQRISFLATAKRANYHGVYHPDSIFGNQIGFIGQDSVLVFLNASGTSQIDAACSKYYRVEPVNVFYQLDGRVADYFIDNDTLAATFTYEHGILEGPVYIFYHNGAIKEKGIYHDKLRNGLWTYYYDNGQKERVLRYENGQPSLLECYARNGDILAQNGNGRFEGTITSSSRANYELFAKGNIKDGVPDGEWNLYSKAMTKPTNTEYFSNGKFRRGVSHALIGNLDYKENYLTSLEGSRSYETIDHYDWRSCRVRSMPAETDQFPDVRNGFTTILQTNKYSSYSGWVFLDVKVGPDGVVESSDVRLHQPDTGFETAIHAMAGRLRYPTTNRNGSPGSAYENMYIILVSGNQAVIPEEILEAQRNSAR